MLNPRDGYLENEVLSASPAKLHLLLIEGAIRSTEQGRQYWHEGRNDLACDALIRAQEIVTQMTAGLNRDANPELCSRIAAVYLFIFRTLVQASFSHDEAQLDDALRVLAIERDTWRAVCEQQRAAAEEPDPNASAPLPPHFAGEFDTPVSGFSLDA
jgi:flagellar protein FliS